LANYLSESLAGIPGISPPTVYPYVKHVYYVYAFKYNEAETGIPRDLFARALNAEGIPVGAGYVKPLYLNPLYQERRAFIYNHFGKEISYNKGICPVAERLHDKELLLTAICRPPATREDIDSVVEAMRKVIRHREELLAFVKGKR
jgi:dTDP-4-amino-4,6-dideoxygalactose transaminase